MRDDDQVTGSQPVVSGRKIHNVHLVDRSGSMSGSKYTNAISGINSEMLRLRNENNGIEYTQTLIEFDSGHNNEMRLVEHYFMAPISKCDMIKGAGAYGGTPLYQAAGELLQKLNLNVPENEVVVMTIFTDGEENSSSFVWKDGRELKNLIDKAMSDKSWAITFMGTKQDTENVIKNLGIVKENTFVHMNTAQSINAAYNMRSASMQTYSKSYAGGASADSLKDSFFSKTVLKTEE